MVTILIAPIGLGLFTCAICAFFARMFWEDDLRLIFPILPLLHILYLGHKAINSGISLFWMLYLVSFMCMFALIYCIETLRDTLKEPLCEGETITRRRVTIVILLMAGLWPILLSLGDIYLYAPIEISEPSIGELYSILTQGQ